MQGSYHNKVENVGRSFLSKLFKSNPPTAGAPDAESLKAYILDFSSQSEDQRQYATTHLGRLVRTLQLTPPGTAADQLLEMGAYMQITPAFHKYLGYGDVRGSYLGPLGTVDEKKARSQSGEDFRCFIDLFDAERDVFPYKDGQFAAVVCAELLEHLSMDPMHLMSEVNRILRADGHFILSTPNICSFNAVSAVLRGEHPGLYQQYIRPRGGAIDPRHAREYAPAEIKRLFEAAGFVTEILETGPYGWEARAPEPEILSLLEKNGYSKELRGETIHVVGRKTGPVRERHPNWLYD